MHGQATHFCMILCFLDAVFTLFPLYRSFNILMLHFYFNECLDPHITNMKVVSFVGSSGKFSFSFLVQSLSFSCLLIDVQCMHLQVLYDSTFLFSLFLFFCVQKNCAAVVMLRSLLYL